MTNKTNEEIIDDIIMNINDIDKLAGSDVNFKCAPGREYEAGSCISLMVLDEMAKAYNSTVGDEDKIVLSKNMLIVNPKKYKLYLVHELQERFERNCESQKCWSHQDFASKLSNSARTELEKYTFRPDSPNGKFTWLSNENIDQVMEQYEKLYPDFKFFGAVPMDFADLDLPINKANYAELYKKGIKKFGIIFNLDEHYKSGSHWTSMYFNCETPGLFYWDSTGTGPELRTRRLMRKQCRALQKIRNIPLKDIRIEYNEIQHQKENTECGVYSINFLIRMARGDDFNTIIKNVISDRQINKCRGVYFDKSYSDKSKNSNKKK